MFYRFAKALLRVFMFFVFRLRVTGREKLPESGGAILAVNHISNWDPVIAGIAYPRRLTFMAKEELFRNPLLGGLIRALGAFPVARGGGELSAVKTSLTILRQERTMLIFPQGHRMKVKGSAKPGVAMLAHRARTPVIPLRISGEYKWMHRITASFGDPISFEEYYGKKLTHEQLQELADGVLDTIWRLEA